MQDSGPNRPSPSSDATGAHPPSAPSSLRPGNDPPTIRSGAAEEGSSLRRKGVLPLPEPGDRLESFELERSIGVGGMGAVFLAVDTRLHREVALKVLPPEQSGDSEVVQRFYQEGRAAARLDHENIARVFTIGTDKGYHFIAFEYIEGSTLRQRVQEHGPLRVDEAINYTLQIAGALVHAAERGVVHRDIKPSNIIVTPQGRAKLVDMGLARRFERGGDDGLTQSGMTLGTFDYISPEQARDPRDVDVRGDLYSLGCTLFHMLTGRPPFPEGTVLQKLLQHQEEPPPDVRSLNPSVPADLGVILAKLMAKDRDRRYQTPELLVRDLLTLAGALGLRSLSPEGLVWMSPRTPPAWEKHLVWGVPAAALAAVVGLLFWWGQPGDLPSVPADPILPGAITPPLEGTGKSAAGPAAIATKAKPPPGEGRPQAASPSDSRPRVSPAAAPRELAVKTAEELSVALAGEASGSTILLADNGPYLLRAAAAPSASRRDLTIRAAAGAHPVIRFSRAAIRPTDPVDPALLAFGPGKVAIDGLDFQVEPGEAEANWSAIRCEGTDLSLSRCLLRSPSGEGAGARSLAIRLRPGPPSASDPDRPSSLRADSCHFDGSQVAVWVKGPADLRIWDCTFGAGEPTFWLDNGGAPAFVPVDLALRHVSIRAGREPVIRSARTSARVVIDHAVVATSKAFDGTLVAIDDPDRLDWRGKDNLYAGIAAYLQPSPASADRDPIRTFAAWSDDPRTFREIRSSEGESPVWAAPDPGSVVPVAKITPSFALDAKGRPAIDQGARRGPLGPIAGVAPSILSGLGPLARAVMGRETAQPRVEPKSAPGFSPLVPMPPPDPKPGDTSPTAPEPAEMPPVAAEDDPPAPMPPTARDPAEAAPANGAMPSSNPSTPPAGDGRRDREPVGGASPIRTSEALVAEVARLGERGGVIKLAADADLRLPPVEVRGPGRIVIEPEGAEARSKLRFRPDKSGSRKPDERTALFRISSGSLELRRIDVILEEGEAPEGGAWDAFTLWAGTELNLVLCTVTIGDRSSRSAVARVVSGDEHVENGVAGADSASAQFRATDCLLRGGGDLVDVAAGRRLDLELSNVIVGTGGSLAHGHGLPRGSTPEPIKLVLRQVLARVNGGLVFLESAPGEPELPLADVVARDAIFATGDRSAPLVRLDGQDAVEALQDRVRWEGSGVIYHQIEVYRRDQTAQTGILPQRFDRQSWEVAVGGREKMPIHGDAAFLDDWPPERRPSSIDRDDARLDLEGPSASAGPDWRRVPQAPSAPRR